MTRGVVVLSRDDAARAVRWSWCSRIDERCGRGGRFLLRGPRPGPGSWWVRDEEMLRLHRGDVDDETWAATVVGDRLRVRGEIDASNVDRFARVLRSAVTAGVSTVDLSEVGFFAVAGVRALLVAAELLHERGQPLTVIDPHVGRGRVLLLSVAADHPGIQLIHKGTLR